MLIAEALGRYIRMIVKQTLKQSHQGIDMLERETQATGVSRKVVSDY